MLKTLNLFTASSSSCNSSVGNLGSPKPEKRQANSPLPPTPKNSTTKAGAASVAHHNGATSLQSSRNSVASVIELSAGNNIRHVSRENLTSTVVDGVTTATRNSVSLGSQLRLSIGDKTDEDPSKKRNSAKNLEGMYAKVFECFHIYYLYY